MYEYDERKDKSSIKGVIVQILLMVMFIFVLICLFPSKSDLDKLKTTEIISSLEPLYDRIFNENIIAMKDAAKSYYTTPRLPKNIGDNVSMTLSEMLDKKIILPFTDRDGNQCDLENSYVSITKKDGEFIMKVNLKCSSQENYLLVTMGCYDYCETGICEKNDSDIKTPVVNPSNPTIIVKPDVVRPIINNNITINICQSENCKPTNYYCQYVNGNYYGKGGNIVDKATYDKECGVAEKYYCKYVNGAYYGKDGNVVSEDVYKKECEATEPVYICKYVNGIYYGKNGNKVDQATYEKECTTPPTPTYICKYVDGIYYGKNGNVVDKATYEKECTTPIQYQCKYMKTTDSRYGDWSIWSDWSENRQVASNLKQERYKTVTQERQEKQLIGYKTITYKDPNKPIYKPKQVLVGQRDQYECAEYGYVITSTGKINTNVTYGEWKSEGLVKLYSTPVNTSTERYTKISVGLETCQTCGAAPYTIYKKEVRSVRQNTTTSEKSEYKCLRTVTHKIPVYGTKQVIADYGTSTKREAVYGLVPVKRQVTLYSYRTRSIIGGTIDYKISNCNDTNLFNQGYQIIDKWQI